MKAHAPEALTASREALAGLEGFSAAEVEAALEPIPGSMELGAGKVYQPIRVAITGTTVSPGIFESVSALGRERTLARIDAALARLAANPPEPAAPAEPQ
jgi:glutamyl-tRNA synthetase